MLILIEWENNFGPTSFTLNLSTQGYSWLASQVSSVGHGEDVC